jgi:hypothetical protein
MEDAMIDESNLVIRGFWQGDFTTMERLCVKSFMANGHEFYLYAYGEVGNVPSGVHLLDANEILPYSRLADFRCSQQFSDFFRIALLLKKGGWYSDLDNICLRPFDFSAEYVFYRDHEETTVSLALSKAPAGSPALRWCYDYLNRISVADLAVLPWQAIGSSFIQQIVGVFGLARYIPSGMLFDPIQWDKIKSVVDPKAKWNLSRSYSLHLFHSVWNTGPEDRTGKGFDLGQPSDEALWTDGEYPAECLYEQLKARYL